MNVRKRIEDVIKKDQVIRWNRWKALAEKCECTKEQIRIEILANTNFYKENLTFRKVSAFVKDNDKKKYRRVHFLIINSLTTSEFINILKTRHHLAVKRAGVINPRNKNYKPLFMNPLQTLQLDSMKKNSLKYKVITALAKEKVFLINDCTYLSSQAGIEKKTLLQHQRENSEWWGYNIFFRSGSLLNTGLQIIAWSGIEQEEALSILSDKLKPENRPKLWKSI